MLGSQPDLGTVPHSIEEYLRAVRGLDVRRIGALVMAPRGDLRATRDRNDRLLALARSRRGRIVPFCSVHPADGRSALRELARAAAAGARGVKLHPNTQRFDVADPGVREVVAEATRLGLPVLFDGYSPFDPAQPGKFVRLAMELPQSRLILAHALGPRFSELLVYAVLERYPWWTRNVWIDLSATGPLFAGGPFAESFVWVLRRAGTDRLLYGSDYPIEDPRTAVAAIASLGFTREELARIFYSNARALFDR